MLNTINIKIDRTVKCHEKVCDVSDRFNPGWPFAFVFISQTSQFEQIGNPFDRVTQDEDKDNAQGDFGQSYFVLFRLELNNQWLNLSCIRSYNAKLIKVAFAFISSKCIIHLMVNNQYV